MSKSRPSWIKKHLRELVPPIIGLITMILVFGVFNSQLISGKIAGASSSPKQQEVVEQNVQLSENLASSSPTIRISKIGIEAPVQFNAKTVDEQRFQELLQNGTVHYPTTAVPGKPGNSVIFGHSSGRWWAPGDYKFIFTKLDQLEAGDKIFIDYDDQRYMYEVIEQKIILPTNLSVLDQNVNHQLTLLTCYPVGSNAKRLVVTAQQVLPEIKQKEDLAVLSSDNTPSYTLPSTTPSFWDSLRDLF